jgi:hypothetical protein
MWCLRLRGKRGGTRARAAHGGWPLLSQKVSGLWDTKFSIFTNTTSKGEKVQIAHEIGHLEKRLE